MFALNSKMAFWVRLALVIGLSLIRGFARAESVSEVQHAWSTARNRVHTLNQKHKAIGQKILSLRQVHTDQHPQVTTALRQSVLIQTQLEAANRNLRAHEGRLAQLIQKRVHEIDQKMLKQAPGLKAGSLSKRKAVAKAISRLREERRGHQTTLRNLREPVNPSKTWRALLNKDPTSSSLSGLQERADFLEDTRDKLLAKRKQLAALLEVSERRMAVAQAEYSFAIEASLFDEQTRVGRVLRNTYGQSDANVDSGSNTGGNDSGGDSEPGGDSNHNGGGNPGTISDPGNANDDDSSAPPPPPMDEHGGFSPTSELALGRPLVNPSPSDLSIVPTPMSTQLPSNATTSPNLGALLELDPGRLEGQIHPNQLKTLLQQLEQAEKALDRSAQQLRQQAVEQP